MKYKHGGQPLGAQRWQRPYTGLVKIKVTPDYYMTFLYEYHTDEPEDYLSGGSTIDTPPPKPKRPRGL